MADLETGVEHLNKKIGKIEKRLKKIDQDDKIPGVYKVETSNTLIPAHSNLYTKRQIMQTRLALEHLYSQHKSDSPGQLLESIGKLGSASPLQQEVLIKLFLTRLFHPKEDEDPIAADEAHTYLAELSKILPNHSNVQSAWIELSRMVESQPLLAKVLENVEANDWKGTAEALRAYLESRYPSTIPLTRTSATKPEVSQMAGVVGLSKDTVRDLLKKDPKHPNEIGLQYQIEYVNGVGYGQGGEIFPKFLSDLIDKLKGKRKEWQRRNEPFQLINKADQTIKDLEQRWKNEVFYRQITGKSYEGLIGLGPLADNPIKEHMLQYELIGSLQKEMAANGSQESLLHHLQQYDALFSSEAIKGLITFLENRAEFGPILDDTGENLTFAEMKTLLERLKETLPEDDLCQIFSEVEELGDYTLQNQYVEIHDAFFAIVTEKEDKPEFGETRAAIDQAFAADPERFGPLYQYWIDQFLIVDQGKNAKKLLGDWSANCEPDTDEYRACKTFKRIREPYIAYQDNNSAVSYETMRQHYLEESKRGDIESEQLDALHISVAFLPFAQCRVERCQRLLGALFKTVGRDFVNHPSAIPGLRGLRDEDFTNHPLYEPTKKMVEGFQLLHNFDPNILPGLLQGLRYRLPVEKKGWNILIWDDADFTPNALKGMLWRQGDTKRNLIALGRLTDAILDAGSMMGYEGNPLLKAASTGLTMAKLLDASKLDLVVDQALSGLFDAFDEAYVETVGEYPEDWKYHAVKQVASPVLATIAALSTHGLFSIPTGFEAGVTVYRGLSVRDCVNQSKLKNIQDLLNRDYLQDAEKKLEELRKADMRADDRDTLEQFQVMLYFSQATQDNQLNVKNKLYDKVLANTNKWLDTPPSDKSSKQMPSAAILQQRGIALLQLRDQLDLELFSDQFSVLLEHFNHRKIMPHQLLADFNNMQGNMVAAKCHLQMAQAQEKDDHFRKPADSLLTPWIKPLLERAGYENKYPEPLREVTAKDHPVAPQPSQPGDPVDLTTAVTDLMLRVDEELFDATKFYVQGEMSTEELKEMLQHPRFELICQRIEEQNGFVQLDGDLTFKCGWVAFLMELIDAKENRCSSKTFQRFGIWEKCDFRPPLEHLFAQLVGKNASDQKVRHFSKILEQFNCQKWEDHQRILVFFALAKKTRYGSAWKSYNDDSVNVKGLCSIIRNTIRSTEIDEKLRKGVKYISYDSVKTLLSQGACPDQVYDTRANTGQYGDAVSQERTNRYLLHILAESRRPDLIQLFAEFGADFQVGNFYDMNALEHLIAITSSENVCQLPKTVAALVRGGIKPNQTNTSFWSVYNDFEGANSLIAAFGTVVHTVQHNTLACRLLNLAAGPHRNSNKLNLQSYAGSHAYRIAELKGYGKELRDALLGKG